MLSLDASFAVETVPILENNSNNDSVSITTFNSIDNQLKPTGNSFSVAQVEDAAVRVKSFIESNKKLPSQVNINNQPVKMSEFLYILTTTTYNLNQSLNSPLTHYQVTEPTYSTDKINSGTIQKTEYLQLAQNIKTYIENTTQAPPYLKSSQGTLSYESQIYLYTRIIAFHQNQKRLPNYATINPWNGQKLPNSTSTPINNTYKIEIINSLTGGTVTRNTYVNQYIPKSALTTAVVATAKQGTPMITFGDGTGPKVMIVAGVHGNELPASIAAMQLINYLNGKELQGTVYIVPFVIPYNTAYSYRFWKGQNPNSVAHILGSPTNVILRKAQQLSVASIGDFHSTRPGGVPGKNSILCTKVPTYESYVLASYISQKTGSALIWDTQAGAKYPGALEDVSNLAGIPTVTCEVRCTHGYANSTTIATSYKQMLAFLNYFKFL